MLTEITKAQLLAFRLGQLKNQGKATTAQISMAKRNNVDMAIKIAREARQVLGWYGYYGRVFYYEAYDEFRICDYL